MSLWNRLLGNRKQGPAEPAPPIFLAKLEQLSADHGFLAELPARDPIALFLHNGTVHAIDARCPHRGGPLEDSCVSAQGEDLCVTCPWHGWEFSLKTGHSRYAPDRIRVHRVDVRDGAVYLLPDAP